MVEGEDAGGWSLLKGDSGDEIGGSGAWWNCLALCAEEGATEFFKKKVNSVCMYA